MKTADTKLIHGMWIRHRSLFLVFLTRWRTFIKGYFDITVKTIRKIALIRFWYNYIFHRPQPKLSQTIFIQSTNVDVIYNICGFKKIEIFCKIFLWNIFDIYISKLSFFGSDQWCKGISYIFLLLFLPFWHPLRLLSISMSVTVSCCAHIKPC